MTKIFLASATAFLLFFSTLSIAQLPTRPLEPKPEQRLNELLPRKESEKEIGDNIVRIMPLRILDDARLGFGIDYEHIFGKDKVLGLVLPLSLHFREDNYYRNNSQYATIGDPYVYFTPGLKIYPFGQRKVTYAVGPNLMLGYGRSTYTDYINGADIFVSSNTFRMGLFVNNYLNVQLTSKFSFGVELGVGARYLNGTLSPRLKTYGDIQPIINFAGSFGYRF